MISDQSWINWETKTLEGISAGEISDAQIALNLHIKLDRFSNWFKLV